MSNISGTERPVLRWAGKLGTFLGLSFFWLLCCLPLVTILPGCVAMYDSIRHCVHGDESGPFRRFWTTLKQEVFRGVLLSLLWIALITIFVYGLRIVSFAGQENSIFEIYSMLYAGTMLIPLQARYELRFFELHRVAMSLAIINLPTTGAVLGIFLLGTLVSLVLLPLLLLVPAITLTIQASLMEKAFAKYEASGFPIPK